MLRVSFRLLPGACRPETRTVSRGFVGLPTGSALSMIALVLVSLTLSGSVCLANPRRGSTPANSSLLGRPAFEASLALWIARIGQGHATVAEDLSDRIDDESEVGSLALATVELDQGRLGVADQLLENLSPSVLTSSNHANDFRCARLLLKAQLTAATARRYRTDPGTQSRITASARRRFDALRRAHDISPLVEFQIHLAAARFDLGQLEISSTARRSPDRDALDRIQASLDRARVCLSRITPDPVPSSDPVGQLPPSNRSRWKQWLHSEWHAVAAQSSFVRGWRTATSDHLRALSTSPDPLHRATACDLRAEMAKNSSQRISETRSAIDAVASFRAGASESSTGATTDRLSWLIQRQIARLVGPRSNETSSASTSGVPASEVTARETVNSRALEALRIVEWSRRTDVKRPSDLDSADWQSRLGADERVVIPFDLGADLAIWVITPNAIHLAVSHKPPEFNTWVAELRGDRGGSQRAARVATRGHRNPKSVVESSGSPGRSLYDCLVAPVDGLEGPLSGAQRVYFAPFGSLRRVPFSMLSSDRGFVFERFVTARLRDARTPQRTWSRPDADTRVLALLDPKVTSNANSPSSSRPRLPAAEDGIRQFLDHLHRGTGIPEISFTQAAFDWQSIFRGSKATIATLKKFGPRADLIHIASHGSHDPIAPARSSLFLASERSRVSGSRVSGSLASGRLTAGEFSRLDLSSAQLVTLSGCETGLAGTEGDNLAGFGQASFAAGAQRLLGSLWPVPDVETGRFMKTFYFYLARGDDPAAALREARLDSWNDLRTKIRTHVSDAATYSFAAWILIETGEH